MAINAEVDPPLSPPSPLQPVDDPRRYRLQFNGNGQEYFRIWVVNLALTVLTLGIYSAWAKVRKQRYFYSNTLLDGSAFGYHAQPLAILKGRLVAVALLGAYFLASRTSVAATVVVALIVAVATPWLVVKSRIFSMRVTSWRGLRFGFRPDYRGGYRALLLWLVIAVMTLGILYPRFTRERYQFLVSRTSYGSTFFESNPEVGRFYRTAFGSAGLAIGLSVIIGVAVYVSTTVFELPKASPQVARVLAYVPAILQYVLILPSILAYVYSRNTTEVLSHTTLGPHRFSAKLSATRLAGIYITNILAMGLSVGLLVPWAQLRVARYKFEAVEMEAHGSLEQFVASGDPGPSGAASEEISSFFDLDFGF